MKTAKSARKPPRPSIDNPRLVVRMKSSVVKKLKVGSLEIQEGRTTRKRTKLGEAGLSSIKSAKSSESFLSTSWIDSLRSNSKGIIMGKKLPPKKPSVQLKSPRPKPFDKSLETDNSNRINDQSRVQLQLNSSKVKKTLETNKSIVSNDESVPTPIQSFKFKPTSVPEVSKTSIVPALGKVIAPTPVAFGRSFHRQTPSSNVKDYANNNVETPSQCLRNREGLRKLNSSRNASINGGKSSPRNPSRQRGVMLPLLKEKDDVIAMLEEKLAACDCSNVKTIIEERDKSRIENQDYQDQISRLKLKVDDITEDLKDSLDKNFDLEDKNMKLFKALETEQSMVESLQSEISHLSAEVSKSTTSAKEETADDLEGLIGDFVEKVSEICVNDNFKISVSSKNKNVKLTIKTRAVGGGSREHSFATTLESTHLCEDQLTSTLKCKDFRQFAALKEVEEISSEDKISKSLKPNDKSHDKGSEKKEDKIAKRIDDKKPRNKTKSSASPELNASMGIKLDNLNLNDDENLNVAVVKRQTRSMSKRNL